MYASNKKYPTVLSNFKIKRDRVISSARSIEFSLLSPLKNIEAAKRIKSIINYELVNGGMKAVILGGVNCGKTSLASALTGIDKLNIGILPSPVSSRIIYLPDNQNRAQICHSGNSFYCYGDEVVKYSRLFDLDDPKDLKALNNELLSSSSKYDEIHGKRIDYNINADVLEAGMIIYDIRSLHDYESFYDTYVSYLENCDAVIFVSNAVSTCSHEEMSLYEKCADSAGGKLFVAVNKYDQIRPKDRRVLKEHVIKKFGSDANNGIYFISALEKLEQRCHDKKIKDADANEDFTRFEHDLYSFLINKAGNINLRNLIKEIQEASDNI